MGSQVGGVGNKCARLPPDWRVPLEPHPGGKVSPHDGAQGSMWGLSRTNKLDIGQQCPSRKSVSKNDTGNFPDLSINTSLPNSQGLLLKLGT